MNLKAFTIIELLVVLALSTIVIFIGWNVHFLISGQFRDYRISKDQYLEVKSLQASLAFDINQANYIVKKENGIEFKFETSSIEYAFKRETVTKTKNDQEESNYIFDLEVISFQGFFEQLPKQNGLIDKLILNIQMMEQQFNYFYYKNYSSEDLMKWHESEN